MQLLLKDLRLQMGVGGHLIFPGSIEKAPCLGFVGVLMANKCTYLSTDSRGREMGKNNDVIMRNTTGIFSLVFIQFGEALDLTF